MVILLLKDGGTLVLHLNLFTMQTLEGLTSVPQLKSRYDLTARGAAFPQLL